METRRDDEGKTENRRDDGREGCKVNTSGKARRRLASAN